MEEWKGGVGGTVMYHVSDGLGSDVVLLVTVLLGALDPAG